MAELFCFIPAKIGSARLPRKNLRLFNGKEMVAYVIEAAKKSELFGDEVIVSTESDEVEAVAIKHGAKCPYKRSSTLAKDPYGVCDVLLDFFDQVPTYRKYKTVCLLLPTSPLNDNEEIVKAYELYRSSGSKGLISVAEMDYSGFRTLIINNKKIVEPLFPDKFQMNSTDLPKTYRINGAIMFLDIDHLLKARTYLFPEMVGHVMPFEKSVDVDTERDAKLAEFLLNYRG